MKHELSGYAAYSKLNKGEPTHLYGWVLIPFKMQISSKRLECIVLDYHGNQYGRIRIYPKQFVFLDAMRIRVGRMCDNKFVVMINNLEHRIPLRLAKYILKCIDTRTNMMSI